MGDVDTFGADRSTFAEVHMFLQSGNLGLMNGLALASIVSNMPTGNRYLAV